MDDLLMKALLEHLASPNETKAWYSASDLHRILASGTYGTEYIYAVRSPKHLGQLLRQKEAAGILKASNIELLRTFGGFFPCILRLYPTPPGDEKLKA